MLIYSLQIMITHTHTHTHTKSPPWWVTEALNQHGTTAILHTLTIVLKQSCLLIGCKSVKVKVMPVCQEVHHAGAASLQDRLQLDGANVRGAGKGGIYFITS